MNPTDQAAFDRSLAEGKHVVLLAEDDPFVRNFLLLILQRQAYAVLVAVDVKRLLNSQEPFRGRFIYS